MTELEDLRARLTGAAELLKTMAIEVRGERATQESAHEAERLLAKRDGVLLAIDYTRSYE